MKYAGMPAGMWLLFSGSFRKRLISVLKYEKIIVGMKNHTVEEIEGICAREGRRLFRSRSKRGYVA